MISAAMRLSFLTDENNIVTIRVPRATLDATNPMVNTAMNEIVRTQAYDTRDRGLLTEPYSAQLVLTDFISFEV